jgi:hypothetical protein
MSTKIINRESLNKENYSKWFNQHFPFEEEPTFNILHQTRTSGLRYYTVSLLYMAGYRELLSTQETKPFIRWIMTSAINWQDLINWDGLGNYT